MEMKALVLMNKTMMAVLSGRILEGRQQQRHQILMFLLFVLARIWRLIQRKVVLLFLGKFEEFGLLETLFRVDIVDKI